MTSGNRTKWAEEADVVVVGYGGAGAIAAINAHDAGANVLIIEKQPADTPTETRHTPNTRMSGGAWFSPTDAEKAALYMEGLAKIAGETLDVERKEMIRTFVDHVQGDLSWLRSIGLENGVPQYLLSKGTETADGGIVAPEFPELPGSDCARIYTPKASPGYRNGAAFFKVISDAVAARGIKVMWQTPGEHLVVENGEVRGIIARRGGKQFPIKAKRAVVLTCGGFEFNEWMKENYLRGNFVQFYGNPGNTGDGINMAIEAGAALWHMNCASWRVAMKFPDFPIAICTQNHEKASMFVDRAGRRFSNERFKLHSFGYELLLFDTYGLGYPRVPCYWIFDEKRRADSPLASRHGACNPPGNVPGSVFYVWSENNLNEIDRGWVMKATTLEALANKIGADPANGGLMKPSVLAETTKRYNQLCLKGEDSDLNRPKWSLAPLEDPPYYAVRLWPGGPNTQGGPKRNTKAQVLRPDNSPVPRLYSAGELGSTWGMLYQGGGNISEFVVFGRLAGTNAAIEKPW